MLTSDQQAFNNNSSTKRRKSNFGKEMPSAVPGVGECRICFEIVPCVKVLDCNHCLCIPCLTKLASGQQEQQTTDTAATPSGEEKRRTLIDCPECRQKTDCTQGVASLKTLYFGKVRCDLCLEKKDTDDIWWCPECLHSICSKCSIKEHSKKGHHISEWNKMEAVNYSIQYLSQVKCARQESGGSETNRTLIKSFLEHVEKCLQKELQIEPDLEDLHYSLISRYGTTFASQLPTKTPPPSPAASGATTPDDLKDGAPRIVAKVLQLAGANVVEALIPKLCSSGFQIEFTIKPEEVAKFLRSKLEFVPQENAGPIVHRSDSSGSTGQDNEQENTFDANVEERLITKPSMKGVVEQVVYGVHSELVVLRSMLEICVYDLQTNAVQFLPLQGKFDCKSICFGQKPFELLVASQSNVKKHEWQLESINVERTPPMSYFTTSFDIDPDDRVADMSIKWCNTQNAFYEIRINEQQKVSEIWKAVLVKKKDKPKLKESLIYQKAQSKVTSLEVIVLSGSKEYHLFVWDEAANSVLRLTVRDNRCYAVIKIVTSPSPISFLLDPKNKLWLYDPLLKQLCHTYGSAVQKNSLQFKQVFSFSKFNLSSIYYTPDAIIGLALDKNNVCVLKFKKEVKKPPLVQTQPSSQQSTQSQQQPVVNDPHQKKLITWQSQPALSATSPVKKSPQITSQHSVQAKPFSILKNHP